TDESRYIIIAGGGKVGVNLARELYENGHEVAVIEVDNARAAALSNKLECPVYIGDSSTHDVLEEASANRARVFVAATGSDQDNLIAILRGNLTVVPRGETRLQEGDMIVALVKSEQEAQLRTALLGA